MVGVGVHKHADILLFCVFCGSSHVVLQLVLVVFKCIAHESLLSPCPGPRVNLGTITAFLLARVLDMASQDVSAPSLRDHVHVSDWLCEDLCTLRFPVKS
jgi:hypothetical protein